MKLENLAWKIIMRYTGCLRDQCWVLLSFSETNTDFILYGDDTTTLNHGWQGFRVIFFGIVLTAGLVAN
jgi:hypothetical protein